MRVSRKFVRLFFFVKNKLTTIKVGNNSKLQHKAYVLEAIYKSNSDATSVALENTFPLT